jgi:hypothetical protein
MFDISDITLIAMSSAIALGSAAVILIVNYRRLPCCRPEAAPVAPQDWVRQPTPIIEAGGKPMRD